MNISTCSCLKDNYSTKGSREYLTKSGILTVLLSSILFDSRIVEGW